MRRVPSTPREQWERKCEALGFVFHSITGGYWNESAAYEFTLQEIDEIETATNELHEMCLEAVEHVIKNDLLHRYQIPPDMYELIHRSWREKEPYLYGRFDLAYNGEDPPKLLEYNADTPTGLLEAADVQKNWGDECHPDRKQFNGLREQLIRTWRKILPKESILHFSCLKHTSEDFGTVDFLRATAREAGMRTRFVYTEDIGVNPEKRVFMDSAEEPQEIQHLFKLYPWEWLVIEPFHEYLTTTRTRFIEPAWKMLLSNKALLPILWDVFPHHPYLLRASFHATAFEGQPHVRKPLLSREGANVTIKRGDTVFETSGVYGEEGHIYQELFELPQFDGRYPVIGSWVIGGEASGIGIREDDSLVTKNTSWFVPHYYVG